jgi:hypothetical protein
MKAVNRTPGAMPAAWKNVIVGAGIKPLSQGSFLSIKSSITTVTVKVTAVALVSTCAKV